MNREMKLIQMKREMKLNKMLSKNVAKIKEMFKKYQV
jgi:hypothetical protein